MYLFYINCIILIKFEDSLHICHVWNQLKSNSILWVLCLNKYAHSEDSDFTWGLDTSLTLCTRNYSHCQGFIYLLSFHLYSSDIFLPKSLTTTNFTVSTSLMLEINSVAGSLIFLNRNIQWSQASSIFFQVNPSHPNLAGVTETCHYKALALGPLIQLKAQFPGKAAGLLRDLVLNAAVGTDEWQVCSIWDYQWTLTSYHSLVSPIGLWQKQHAFLVSHWHTVHRLMNTFTLPVFEV